MGDRIAVPGHDEVALEPERPTQPVDGGGRIAVAQSRDHCGHRPQLRA